MNPKMVTITHLKEPTGKPYITKAEMGKMMNNACERTVSARIKEIEKLIEAGRYSHYAVIRDGGIMLINYLVVIDYLAYSTRLKDKNARKHVPPYDPYQVAQEIGFYIDTDEEAM